MDKKKLERTYICPKCSQSFTRSNRLQSHLNRKKPCRPDLETSTTKKIQIKMKQTDPIICLYCQKKFSTNDNLLIHLKQNRCYGLNNNTVEVLKLKKQLSEKDKQIAELKDNPIIQKLEKQMTDLRNEVREKQSNEITSKEIAEFKQITSKEIADLRTEVKANGPKVINNNLQMI